MRFIQLFTSLYLFQHLEPIEEGEGAAGGWRPALLLIPLERKQNLLLFSFFIFIFETVGPYCSVFPGEPSEFWGHKGVDGNKARWLILPSHIQTSNKSFLLMIINYQNASIPATADRFAFLYSTARASLLEFAWELETRGSPLVE